MGIFKRFSTLTATHTKSPRLYATIANRQKKKTAFKAANVIAKKKTSLQPTGNQIPQKIFFNKYNIFLDVL